MRPNRTLQGWPAAAGGASASQLGLAVALVAFLTSAVGGNCGWFARGFRAAAVLAVALCVAAWQVRGGKYPVLSSLIQPSIQPAKQ